MKKRKENHIILYDFSELFNLRQPKIDGKSFQGVVLGADKNGFLFLHIEPEVNLIYQLKKFQIKI